MRLEFLRPVALVSLMLLPCLAFSACTSNQDSGSEDRSTAANWAPLDPGAVTSRSTIIDVGVVRAECAGGETGNITEARVDYQSEKVIVVLSLEPVPEAAQDCPENETVPFQLLLDQPLGERELIDGTCMDNEYEKTVMCSDQGVRWNPSMN